MERKIGIFCIVMIALWLIVGCTGTPIGSGGGVNSSSSSSISLPNTTPETVTMGDGTWYNSICYSGYRLGEGPGVAYPTELEILEDLQILTNNGNWKYIRMYDNSPHAENTLKAIKDYNLPIKVYMGVAVGYPVHTPISSGGIYSNSCYASDSNEITNFLRLYSLYSDEMVAVSVGNEIEVDWSDHQVPGALLVSYIQWIKSQVSIPVGMDDDFGWWSKASWYNNYGSYDAILAAVDFVGAHIYPLKVQVINGTDTGLRLAGALANTITSYNSVKSAVGNKYVVIGEAGWATGGTFSQTYTGQANEYYQKTYYNQLITWAKQYGILTFWFEAFDEAWKGTDIEGYWGLFMDYGGTNRVAKYAMYDLYPSLVDPSHVPTTDTAAPVDPSATNANSPITDSNYVVYSESVTGTNAAGIWNAWNSTVAISDDTSTFGEGTSSKKYTVTSTGNSQGWFGGAFEISTANYVNLTQFASGHLNFMINTTLNLFSLGFQIKPSGTSDEFITLTNGNFGFQNDGNWHAVSIPISILGPGANLSKVNAVFAIKGGVAAAGASINVDNIYWSKN